MDSAKKAHIERNLVELIKTTVCNCELLSYLQQQGILSQCDIEDVQSQKTHFEKSRRLYEILPTKAGAFEEIAKALKNAKQSGALALLEQKESEFKHVELISVDFNHVIGKGRSTVYRGKFDGRDVAVKVIREELQRAIKEVEILKKLDIHENIVRYFLAEQKKKKVYIALELCLVNLEDELKIRLVKSEPVRVLEECTKGIAFLHKNEIIHGDLKPANILFNQLGQIKISDFGLSKQLEAGISSVSVSGVHGTLDWMAPEILNLMQNTSEDSNSFRNKVSKKTDIFSLGCIFYYVLSSGHHLFGHPYSRSHNIIENNPQWKNASIDDVSKELIRRMVSKLPSYRPAVEEILTLDLKQSIKPLPVKKIIQPLQKNIKPLPLPKNIQPLPSSEKIKFFLSSKNMKPLAFKQINILILGETGVGKSTWINNFLNLLTYGSLENAMGERVLTLIPSEFTMVDENFEEVLISVGPYDTNENTKSCQLATQSSRVYQFGIGSTIVRMIDTPGIGNYDQDRKIFQNVLGTLSLLNELHGICILLKPNNVRIGILFEFCIKEILANFHKDASQNIMFCFTNSRGTFYRPGDSLPTLKKLLSKIESVKIPLQTDTVYCFDSEAYRFLAARKNDTPVTFDDTDVESFHKSWNKSIEETARMLEHIRKLKPHKIRSTVFLRVTREITLEIFSKIQENKCSLAHYIENLRKIDIEIKDLERKKVVNRGQLDYKRLDHPHTECTNTNCTKLRKHIGLTTAWEKVCHDRCNLDGPIVDRMGTLELLKCSCMSSNGLCRFCGHSYIDHLITYRKAVERVVQIEDPGIVVLLEQKRREKDFMKPMIESKRLEISKFEQTERASAKLALFFKSNCINLYNDAAEGYLEHCILEEQAREYAGKNGMQLKNLKTCLRQYIEEKQVLDKSLKSLESNVTLLGTEGVQRILEELKDSPQVGPQIQQKLECLKQVPDITHSNILVSKPNMDFSATTSTFCKKLANIFL